MLGTWGDSVCIKRDRFTPHILGISAALIAFSSVCAFAQAPVSTDRIDYSRTNSVGILLSEPERGGRLRGQGLEHAFWEPDGLTVSTNVRAVPCRSLDMTAEGRSKGYFYFAIDPRFKRREVSHVKIEIDYFDGPPQHLGVFGVQYDALREPENRNARYKQALPNVPLKGSNKWLTATFHISDAVFQNSQNANSDFRIWASPPELCISRVVVSLETAGQSPKPKPLQFTSAGEAPLHDWNVQWDSGAKPQFATQTAGPNTWLDLRAPGSHAAGSWRTAVFLQPGAYVFVGKVKTLNLTGHAGLRLSFRPGGDVLNRSSDWTELKYDFTVVTPEYVELVCELRAQHGSARFDAASLKLFRK